MFLEIYFHTKIFLVFPHDIVKTITVQDLSLILLFLLKTLIYVCMYQTKLS